METPVIDVGKMVKMVAVKADGNGGRQAPIGHGFNEEGLVLCHGSPPGLLGGIIHGEHVIAIHTD